MSSREWAPCFRSGNVEFQLLDGLIVGAIEVSAKLSDLASSKGVSDAAVKHLDELKTSVRKAFGSTMQSSSDMVASLTRQFQTLVDCVKIANGEEELLSVTRELPKVLHKANTRMLISSRAGCDRHGRIHRAFGRVLRGQLDKQEELRGQVESLHDF